MAGSWHGGDGRVMACWRHVRDFPVYGLCCYHAQFQAACYQKNSNLRLQWRSGQCETERCLWWTRRRLLFWCKDVSACVIYSTQFQEVVIRSIPISDCSGQCEWHGSGREMAGERHGMCESVFKTAGEQHGNGMVLWIGPKNEVTHICLKYHSGGFEPPTVVYEAFVCVGRCKASFGIRHSESHFVTWLFRKICCFFAPSPHFGRQCSVCCYPLLLHYSSRYCVCLGASPASATWRRAVPCWHTDLTSYYSCACSKVDHICRWNVLNKLVILMYWIHFY
jgi:hypothetical protein